MKCCLRYQGEIPRNLLQAVKDLGLPPYMARLLAGRGILDRADAEEFLYPQLVHLPGPDSFREMEQAVGLITKTLEEQGDILIYGDYDADGICATTLLVEFFSCLGRKAHWYVPDRLGEGYGLDKARLLCLRKALGRETPPLLITVDNGISAVEEVETARTAGFRVIVTDHHEPGEKLPPANAILNPKTENEFFPLKNLSGAGVAFYLAWGVRNHHGTNINNNRNSKRKKINLKKLLDLVCLGTIADVMAMDRVNRILVRAGLEVISAGTRQGLKALCRQAGVRQVFVGSEDIAYRLAPRLNASGRVDRAERAVRLLLEEDRSRAAIRAAEIEQINGVRKKLADQASTQALEMASVDMGEGRMGLPVIVGRDFHPGVVGIAAARISERLERPALVLAPDPRKPGLLRGSGRSRGGFDLFQAVASCAELLEGYGGHPMAVGLSVRTDKLGLFRERLTAIFAQTGQARQKRSCQVVDLALSDPVEDGEQVVIDKELVRNLRLLQPFDSMNPEPSFLYRNVRLKDMVLARGQHLRFHLELEDDSLAGIGFEQGKKWLHLARNGPVDMIFTVQVNLFQGRDFIQVRAVDIMPTS